MVTAHRRNVRRAVIVLWPRTVSNSPSLHGGRRSHVSDSRRSGNWLNMAGIRFATLYRIQCVFPFLLTMTLQRFCRVVTTVRCPNWPPTDWPQRAKQFLTCETTSDFVQGACRVTANVGLGLLDCFLENHTVLPDTSLYAQEEIIRSFKRDFLSLRTQLTQKCVAESENLGPSIRSQKGIQLNVCPKKMLSILLSTPEVIFDGPILKHCFMKKTVLIRQFCWFQQFMIFHMHRLLLYAVCIAPPNRRGIQYIMFGVLQKTSYR